MGMSPVRFPSNPHWAHLFQPSSNEHHHTVSIGASRTCFITCIDLSLADGLDTHALNTEELATQEFHETRHDPHLPEGHPSFPEKNLPDDVYMGCQNYPTHTIAFEGRNLEGTTPRVV